MKTVLPEYDQLLAAIYCFAARFGVPVETLRKLARRGHDVRLLVSLMLQY